MALKKSAGFAFIWEDKILLSHATGAAWRFYSIIKGQQEEGETLLETALREVKEEANIVLTPALLAQVENRPPDFVVQNSSKVLTGWYIRISRPEEIGMKTTLDKHEKLHTIIPKEQLQDEEIDWAGFVSFKDAEAKIAPYQMPILEGAKKLPKELTVLGSQDAVELRIAKNSNFGALGKDKPISKAAQEIIKPEWDKMQEFLNDADKKFLKEHIIVGSVPKYDFKKSDTSQTEAKKFIWQIPLKQFQEEVARETDVFKSYPKSITDYLKIVSVYHSPTGGTNEFSITNPTATKAREYARFVHYWMVQSAFNAGKTIPAEVMLNYPKMKKTGDATDALINSLQMDTGNPRITEKATAKKEKPWFTPSAEKFVPFHQLEFLKELDDEGLEEYREVFERINRLTAEMPHTYQTDKIPYKEKTIWLHYFYSSGDWWILEKDKGSPKDKEKGVQHQAFGIANLNGGADEMGGGLGEMGYISIEELREIPQVEMDFHFEPTKVSDLIYKREGGGHKPGNSPKQSPETSSSKVQLEIEKAMTVLAGLYEIVETDNDLEYEVYSNGQKKSIIFNIRPSEYKIEFVVKQKNTQIDSGSISIAELDDIEEWVINRTRENLGKPDVDYKPRNSPKKSVDPTDIKLAHFTARLIGNRGGTKEYQIINLGEITKAVVPADKENGVRVYYGKDNNTGVTKWKGDLDTTLVEFEKWLVETGAYKPVKVQPNVLGINKIDLSEGDEVVYQSNPYEDLQSAIITEISPEEDVDKVRVKYLNDYGYTDTVIDIDQIRKHTPRQQAQPKLTNLQSVIMQMNAAMSDVRQGKRYYIHDPKNGEYRLTDMGKGERIGDIVFSIMPGGKAIEVRIAGVVKGKYAGTAGQDNVKQWVLKVIADLEKSSTPVLQTISAPGLPMNFNAAYDALADALENDNLTVKYSDTFEFKLLMALLQAGFSVDVFAADLHKPNFILIEKDNASFRVEVLNGSYLISRLKSINLPTIILYWHSLEERHQPLPQEEDLIIQLLIDRLNQLI